MEEGEEEGKMGGREVQREGEGRGREGGRERQEGREREEGNKEYKSKLEGGGDYISWRVSQYSVSLLYSYCMQRISNKQIDK